MAHALSLTNGTTTINLADGSSCFVERYSPRAPELALLSAQTLTVYGEELDGVAYRNVTESIDLLLRASSVALLQTLTRSIEAMLEEAHQRQRTKFGSRVYLQIQLDGEASLWRSELVSGRLVMNGDGLNWWPNKAVEMQLILQRRPYWEGPETELELSTSNQAAATGGRTIYNHDDAGTGHDNWVQIAAAQVTGSLPAPLRLQLTNTSGATCTYSTIYLSMFDGVDLVSDSMFAEAEAVWAAVADANSSGGYYGEFEDTLEADGSINVLLLFTLSSGFVQKIAGRYVKILARLTEFKAPMWVTVKLLDDLSHEIWRGPEVLVGLDDTVLNLKDFGTFPLPSLGGTPGALGLAILFRTQGVEDETITLGVDFIQLTPVSGLRTLRLGNTLVATTTGIIIDDAIENVSYFMFGANRYAGIVVDGTLLVRPGRLHRLMVLCDESDDQVNIARTFSIRAWYRPRRMSI